MSIFRSTLQPALAVCLATGTGADVPRTPAGHPDLSGFYDSATLTPLQRPVELGEQKYLSREEADRIVARTSQARTAANQATSPDREAPPLGGEEGPKTGGGGGTGGYNNFWLDYGDDVIEIDGKVRTSIIYDPPNGRQPPMTPAGQKKVAENFSSFTYVNDGTPSWLDKEGPGPFDGPESLALAERCLLGFSAGPPSIPGVYNNFKRIIQTEDHVMILLEMVHDARVIRLNSEHAPKDRRTWLGDAIGWWEGDTLVVETTNFKTHTGLYGGDENLQLTERFTLQEDGNLLYDFTVDDPTAWTAPWSGEYVWQRSKDKVYEYACHEGNYAMGNILRGARLLEREELERRAEAAGED
ncbi:MAG: hypothetical protein AAF513_06715 [Pseudomonadota bacterium]